MAEIAEEVRLELRFVWTVAEELGKKRDGSSRHAGGPHRSAGAEEPKRPYGAGFATRWSG